MYATHRKFDLTSGVKSASIAVVNTGSEIFVLYHKTLVFHIKGQKFQLQNGGWDTVSTRHVINNALYQAGIPYCLARKKGTTYLLKTNAPGEYGNPKKDSEVFESGRIVKLKLGEFES